MESGYDDRYLTYTLYRISVGAEHMTYDYTCPECKVTISIERSIHAEADAPICQQCSQLMARVWNTPNISFKGSGFYVNDK